MKYTVFGLVKALVILLAYASLAYADEAQGSSENITANITPNITLNATGDIPANASQNATRSGRVLRAGWESARASKALGGNASIPKGGIDIGLESKPVFILSQRRGDVSIFTANSDIYTPLFSQNQYRRTKSAYQAPDNLSNREVYNITGYPVIMLPNSIP